MTNDTYYEACLWNTTDGHRKFWAAEKFHRTVTCRWGRLGSFGQMKTFVFRTETLASIFVTRKVDSKLRKGYVRKNFRASL